MATAEMTPVNSYSGGGARPRITAEEMEGGVWDHWPGPSTGFAQRHWAQRQATAQKRGQAIHALVWTAPGAGSQHRTFVYPVEVPLDKGELSLEHLVALVKQRHAPWATPGLARTPSNCSFTSGAIPSNDAAAPPPPPPSYPAMAACAAAAAGGSPLTSAAAPQPSPDALPSPISPPLQCPQLGPSIMGNPDWPTPVPLPLQPCFSASVPCAPQQLPLPPLAGGRPRLTTHARSKSTSTATSAAMASTAAAVPQQAPAAAGAGAAAGGPTDPVLAPAGRAALVASSGGRGVAAGVRAWLVRRSTSEALLLHQRRAAADDAGATSLPCTTAGVQAGGGRGRLSASGPSAASAVTLASAVGAVGGRGGEDPQAAEGWQRWERADGASNQKVSGGRQRRSSGSSAASAAARFLRGVITCGTGSMGEAAVHGDSVLAGVVDRSGAGEVLSVRNGLYAMVSRPASSVVERATPQSTPQGALDVDADLADRDGDCSDGGGTCAFLSPTVTGPEQGGGGDSGVALMSPWLKPGRSVCATPRSSCSRRSAALASPRPPLPPLAGTVVAAPTRATRVSTGSTISSAASTPSALGAQALSTRGGAASANSTGGSPGTALNRHGAVPQQPEPLLFSAAAAAAGVPLHSPPGRAPPAGPTPRASVDSGADSKMPAAPLVVHGGKAAQQQQQQQQLGPPGQWALQPQGGSAPVTAGAGGMFCMVCAHCGGHNTLLLTAVAAATATHVQAGPQHPPPPQQQQQEAANALQRWWPAVVACPTPQPHLVSPGAHPGPSGMGIMSQGAKSASPSRSNSMHTLALHLEENEDDEEQEEARAPRGKGCRALGLHQQQQHQAFDRSSATSSMPEEAQQRLQQQSKDFAVALWAPLACGDHVVAERARDKSGRRVASCSAGGARSSAFGSAGSYLDSSGGGGGGGMSDGSGGAASAVEVPGGSKAAGTGAVWRQWSYLCTLRTASAGVGGMMQQLVMWRSSSGSRKA